MPVKAGDLEVVASIRDEVTPGMAGIAAGVAAVAAGLIAAGKKFADFEGSMNAVKAVTGATSEEMGRMSALAKEMGASTAFSAKEAADGMAFLGRAGFSANEIIEALPATLNLAAAGQLDLATASDIASNVLSGFNKNTSELGEVTDVMALAAASANTSVQALGQGIAIVGPVAANVGVSLEETAAAIGLLGDKGVPAEVAATGLRGAISRLLNPSKEASEALTRLGVTATDSTGEMRPFADILGDLEKGGLSAGDAMKIFGQRAGPVMLNLVSTGTERFRKFTKELENSEGAAQDMADTMVEGLHGSFVKLDSAVDTAMVNIGESISGILIPVLTQAAESATALGDAFQGAGEVQSESARRTIEDWEKVRAWFDEYTTWYEDRTGVTAQKAEEALRDRIRDAADEAWKVWREGAEEAAGATGVATEAIEDNTGAVDDNSGAVEASEAVWKKWTAEVDRLSAQMDLAKRINEEMMSSLTGQSEVAIEDVIGQFGRLGPEAFDPIEPGLVAPSSRATVEMNKTFQQGMNEAISIISTGLDAAGQQGAANFLRRISSMVSTALSMISRVQSLLGSSAAGGGAGAGAGAAGAGAAVAGAAALTAAAYGVGRVATGIIDTAASNRYGVEETQRRYPLAGTGVGTPTPPDQHIHINIDGQEVASILANRLPGVADEEGW